MVTVGEIFSTLSFNETKEYNDLRDRMITHLIQFHINELEGNIPDLEKEFKILDKDAASLSFFVEGLYNRFVKNDKDN
jgi:hypothetical protein